MKVTLKLLLVISHINNAGSGPDSSVDGVSALGVVGLNLGHAIGFIMVPLTTLLGAQHYV